jgi:Peptidase A4 family
MRRSLAVLPLLALVAALTGGVSTLAEGSPTAAAPAHHGAPIAVLKASQSTNWFGYNQGALETGKSLFHAITANWTVPRASQHKKGEDEYSSTWGGIGGGCLETSCTVTDQTLIQAGTEQDVVSGKPQYSAWWELIPAPGITITDMKVAPGDVMHLDIHEVITNSEVWSITLTNVTRHQTFNQTVPYTSTYGTAEWIEETPLIIGANGGLAPLPNLTRTAFDAGTANGANPHLTPDEEIQLVNANTNKVYAVPSAPDSDTDGAAVCAWATTCGVPSS